MLRRLVPVVPPVGHHLIAIDRDRESLFIPVELEVIDRVLEKVIGVSFSLIR